MGAIEAEPLLLLLPLPSAAAAGAGVEKCLERDARRETAVVEELEIRRSTVPLLLLA